MVVALDELGHLTCCYLGTDPSIFSSGTASRELNYEVRVQTCYASLCIHYESILLCSLLWPFVSSEEPFLAPSEHEGQCALFRVSHGTPCFFVQELDREMKELQQVIQESERGQSMSVQTWSSSIHAALSLY